jgi:hypothetical protein
MTAPWRVGTAACPVAGAGRLVIARVIATGEASRGLGSSATVSHCSSSWAACRSWPRGSATTPGSMRVTSRPAHFPSSRAPATAGAAGHIGHVRAPLVEDQIQAGAQAIPTLLERRDERVARHGSSLSRFLGGLPLVAAQFGDSETTPGSMRVTNRSAS